MSVAEAANISDCTVAVLVPHPESPAMLWASPSATDPEASRTLPFVVVDPEPSTGDVVASLARGLGESVTLLRMNAVSWHSNFDANAIIAEIEPLSNRAPEGFCWREFSDADVATIHPAWAREAVSSWTRERQAGWSDLRPQWSRPGWLVEAGSWMRAQMIQAEYKEPESPRIHQLWGVSVVLSARSLTGTAFFKCSGDRFRHEPLLTRALASHSPTLLPDVVAVEPNRGWLLMRDLQAPLLGDQPESKWDVGLDALVSLQHEWLGRTGVLLELGSEPRPLDELATWVSGTAGDRHLMSRLTPDTRDAWTAAVPTMVEACRRLDQIGPGPSLVHGDLHPWNVVANENGTRIFDWTDASVGHPFLDLVTYVMRTDNLEIRRSLFDRYLDGWSAFLSREDLKEAGRLALVVGALYQAHTYSKLLPTVMPDDLGQLRDGDIGWLKRALLRRDHGLEGPY